MGQHKTNPNVQLAKEGKLPPKKRPMGKRAAQRLIYEYIKQQTNADMCKRLDPDLASNNRNCDTFKDF